MTTKELIEALDKYDDDTEVRVPVFEFGNWEYVKIEGVEPDTGRPFARLVVDSQ